MTEGVRNPFDEETALHRAPRQEDLSPESRTPPLTPDQRIVAKETDAAVSGKGKAADRFFQAVTSPIKTVLDKFEKSRIRDYFRRERSN